MATLKNKQFNIRVIVNKKGEPSLGFVHRFHPKKGGGGEWKSAPDGIRRALERALAITQ